MWSTTDSGDEDISMKELVHEELKRGLKIIYLAVLAEKTESYDANAGYMELVGKGDDGLSVEARNLLPVAYTGAVDGRRAAGRIETKGE